jgi:hypothetical protein
VFNATDSKSLKLLHIEARFEDRALFPSHFGRTQLRSDEGDKNQGITSRAVALNTDFSLWALKGHSHSHE